MSVTEAVRIQHTQRIQHTAQQSPGIPGIPGFAETSDPYLALRARNNCAFRRASHCTMLDTVGGMCEPDRTQAGETDT